ncbi:MAG: hypothetical protein HY321_09990 [Armatimonadetes bacterium]|nr:hypothetical protein [Armatimonadota bacterium]
MITREEAIRRLDGVAREIAALRGALVEGWQDESARDATRAFLEKCGGWEDTRTPDEIVADIYGARTASDRGADAFSER